MAITINTSSSYNVIINLGEPGAQVQTLPFWTYSPRISGVLPIFSPPLELGVVFQLTIRGLSPQSTMLFTQPPNLLQSNARFARGTNTSLFCEEASLSIRSPHRVLSSSLTRSVNGYVWLVHQLLKWDFAPSPGEHRRGAFATSETFFLLTFPSPEARRRRGGIKQIIIAVSCPGSSIEEGPLLCDAAVEWVS